MSDAIQKEISKKTLFLLHEGFYEGVDSRIKLLRDAAEGKGVECIVIDSLKADYSALPILRAGDMLYNCARGSQVLESLLLNSDVATFYIRNPDYTLLSSMTTLSMVHDKAGLKSPKTIYALTDNRDLLKRYVDVLGGFPVILKAEGSTRGIGTLKIESWQALISTADYLVHAQQKFILRQYIEADYGARVMVLGGKAIAVAKFLFQDGDFRNAPILSQTRYEPIEITPDVSRVACDAVRLANLEMGGVDFLYGRDGMAYLLEVNFPTGFQSFKDAPDHLLDHLLDKSRRIHDRSFEDANSDSSA